MKENKKLIKKIYKGEIEGERGKERAGKLSFTIMPHNTFILSLSLSLFSTHH